MTNPATPLVMAELPNLPHRCIKPHCPTSCSGCNHTISGRDEARNLICDMLDEFANDGHGATFEDGEHPLVDRARAYLCRANAEFEPHGAQKHAEAIQAELEAVRVREKALREALSYDAIYSLVRGTGYVTKGQADEITTLLRAALAIPEQPQGE